MADGIGQLIQLIEEKGSVDAGVQEALRISNPVRFEGDNYSDEWVEEAERRGLPHYRKTPHALRVLTEDSTIQLFKELNILSELELNSQYHVKLEQYITHVTIEVEMLEQLVNQFVIPAAIAQRTAACADVAAQASVFGAHSVDRTHATLLHQTIIELHKAHSMLKTSLKHNTKIDNEQEQAEHLALEVAPQMDALRSHCDALEELIEDSRWMLPKYREMLFQN